MKTACAVVFGAVIVLVASSAFADDYVKSFKDSDGGSWAMLTNEPDWGGVTKTRLNDPAGQTFPAVGSGEDQNTFMFGAGHHAAASDLLEPTTHSWGLFKFDLNSLVGTGKHATTDGVISMNVWWNHFNQTWFNTVDTNAASGNYGHGSDGSDWIAGSLALYEVPAGKIVNSNALSPATYQDAFKNASYSSATSDGADATWLPINGSSTPVATWDGKSSVTFVIPKELINRWIEHPETYNGLLLASANHDQQFTNGAIYCRPGDSGDTLSFTYAQAPEPVTMGLLLAGGLTLLPAQSVANKPAPSLWRR